MDATREPRSIVQVNCALMLVNYLMARENIVNRFQRFGRTGRKRDGRCVLLVSGQLLLMNI